MRPSTLARIGPILVLAGVLAGCGSGPSPQAQLQKARAHIADGKNRVALIELKTLVSQHPDDTKARLALGTLLFKLGNPAAAAAQLEQVRKLAGPSDEIELPLAQALIQSGRNQHALEILHPNRAASPALKAPLLIARGEAELGLGKTQDAEYSFDAALALDPHLARALAGKGAVALASGKPAHAIELAGKALAVDARSAWAWQVKGEAQIALRQVQSAAQSLQKALDIGAPALSPQQLFFTRGRLAQAEMALRQYAGARKLIDAMLRQSPKHPYANSLRGLLAYEQKDYATAAQHLQTALNANPYNARALTLLGAAEAAQGQTVLAINHLTGALAQDPSNSVTRRLLASLELRADESEKAIQTLIANTAPGVASGQILSLFASPGKAVQTLTALQAKTAGTPQNSTIRLALAQALLLGAKQQQALSVLNDIHGGNAALDAQGLKASAYLRAKEPAKAVALAQALVREHPRNATALRLAAAIFSAAKADAQAESTLLEARAVAPHAPAVTNDLGALLLRRGRLDQASEAFHASLQYDPKNLYAALALARIAAVRKDSTAALKWLQRAQIDHPDALMPLVILAQYRLLQHQAPQALAIAQQAVAVAPGNPAVLALLGRVLLAGKRDEEAVSVFRAAARAAPDDPRYALDLAFVQTLLKRYRNAQETLAKIVTKHPGFVPVVRALALAQWRNKQPEAAFATARALAKQPRGEAPAAAIEGDLYFLRKGYADALHSYRRALALAPTQALALKGYAAGLRAHVDAPESPLLGWLKTHPDDARTRAVLAGYYLGKGDNKKAEAQYRLALNNAPDDPAILNNLAWLVSQNDPAQALPLAEKAHHLAPETPQILDTLGWILLRHKQPVQALALLRQAAAAMPDIPQVQYHYARALTDGGRPAQAAALLKTILAKYPSFQNRAAAEALLQHLGHGG